MVGARRTPRIYLALVALAFIAVAVIVTRGLSSDRRHDAWRGCRARIRFDGPERCAFLHLCANEAPLSAAERARLLRRIRATPGCADP